MRRNFLTYQSTQEVEKRGERTNDMVSELIDIPVEQERLKSFHLTLLATSIYRFYAGVIYYWIFDESKILRIQRLC